MLLFPSFHEGYGWPPLEAMACGTPVIASDCPSLVEIADGAALLAPARDVAALTRAAQSLLDSDELAADLRARGIARGAQYTWQRTVDGFASVYERVAEEAKERARLPLEDRSCAA
jgi:glycosyltransferase involved in cell wall biosynthesis